jgi:hypothetical protein
LYPINLQRNIFEACKFEDCHLSGSDVNEKPYILLIETFKTCFILLKHFLAVNRIKLFDQQCGITSLQTFQSDVKISNQLFEKYLEVSFKALTKNILKRTLDNKFFFQNVQIRVFRDLRVIEMLLEPHDKVPKCAY